MNNIPQSYTPTLLTIKEKINATRYQTIRKSNHELISLYWYIGKVVSEKTKIENWGKNIVEKLAIDLQSEYPSVKGFSSRNIWYIQKFYDTYSSDEKLQRVVAEIPWGQNIEIFTKLLDSDTRYFYLKMCSERAWSRPTLLTQIKANLYQNYKSSQNNFVERLPDSRINELAEYLLSHLSMII